MYKVLSCIVTASTMLVSCSTTPPPEYPATIVAKRYEDKTTSTAFAPWMPSGLQWIEMDVPEKFILSIRYCQPQDANDCRHADVEVPKEAYEKLQPNSFVIYKNGEIKLS